MLEAEGWELLVQSPHVDDGLLSNQGTSATAWSAAMAWLKARSVMVGPPLGVPHCTILAADTVCDLDGRVIGQPGSIEEARSILKAFRGRSHEVVTSVCLLEPAAGRRCLFSDSACVVMGDLSDEMIDDYVETDLWKGKAGGYNLFEREQTGWPLEWTGDETTIVGLPMRKLRSILPTVQPEGTQP
tara:strand:- start:3173 stop:3730 length:558 start_codon:yes stop_codon:yes gene_type:complete